MNKPTLTPEQARAIELTKMFDFQIPGILETLSKGEPFPNPKYSPLETLDIFTIMSALVNGYEIEKSPEEKLREYYEMSRTSHRDARDNSDDVQHMYYCGKLNAIESVLDIIGITIEGINADKA